MVALRVSSGSSLFCYISFRLQSCLSFFSFGGIEIKTKKQTFESAEEYDTKFAGLFIILYIQPLYNIHLSPHGKTNNLHR